jgi:ATP-binding cassette, subfamily B, bacterial MsbA
VANPSSSFHLYLRLLGYVKPHWGVYTISLLAMAVVAATEPAVPALMKPFLDGTFVEKDLAFAQWIPLAMVGIVLVRGGASFVADYCTQWVAHKVVVELRRQMFATLVRLPTMFYDASTSGNLVSKFTFTVQGVAGAATNAVTIIVKDSLAVIGLLAWLIYLNWRLTLAALIVGPLIVAIVRKLSKRLRKMAHAEQEAMGDLNQVLDESIGCHRVVKVFGGQVYEVARFERAADRIRQVNMKTAVAAALNSPLTQLVASIAVAAIVYYVLFQAVRGQTTVGSFISFLVALFMLLPPLKRLTGVNVILQRGLAAAESVFEMIDQKPEPDTGTVEIARARGEVEFRDVTVRYAGAARPAIEKISFKVAAGETVALVGASGSGKTTVVNLLPRFYTPAEGAVLIDGVNIADLKLASLRGNLAFVSQEIVLFNDTVAANIGYGRLGAASEAEIIAAAEAAHAAAFVRELPAGFATQIGEDGVKLSGGQRQRLAIARAFLKNAPILILDEATSALDSESERHVQEALETLMRGRTTFVIAHRLATVQKADRIVVLDQGRMVEIGRHADLLARNGTYARLYRMQLLPSEETAARERIAASGG